MFYSQTFLARKGPLGTVWCAAHLQHRLKKSHYTSTNIPSTVDRIMFPEVPIALRMSGHLLLGVVRIYSKKVDYLYHDCNVVLIGLRKAFSSVDVNLPEDATHAPAHTITLPDKFDLDSLVLDDFIYDGDDFDHHLRSREEITLTEQIPVERDIYVAISFDEEFTTDFMPPEEVPGSGGNQMEDPLCAAPLDVDMGFQDTVELFNANMDIQDPGASGQKELPPETVDMQDPGASNRTEILTETLDIQEPGASNRTEILGGTMEEPGPSSKTEVLNARLTDNTAPESLPETEVMRDAIHDFSTENLPPLFSDRGNDSTEPTGLPDQTMNEKEIQTPILDVPLDSSGQSLQIQHCSKQPASAVSQEVPEDFDTYISLGHSSPALAIRSTPVQLQHQKPKARKRNLLDKAIVLPNKVMKKALEDTSDLLRRKRNLTSSALGVWKLNNSVRKEQVFEDPLMTGLSLDICQIFKKDYISAKPHLVAVEENFPEPMVTDCIDHETEAIPEPFVADSPVPAAEAVSNAWVVQSPSHTTETIPEPRIAESLDHTAEGIQGPGFASSSIPMPEIDIEIERLRHEESNVGNDNLPEFMCSPLRRDDVTPFSNNSLGSWSVPQAGTTIGSSVLPTADASASAGTHGSAFATPRTFLEEQLGLDHTGLSDIPELNSAEAEDLSFLEADNNTPTGSQAGQGVDTLSGRTRAVAQYLKQHSPITPASEDPSGHLSLNKILAGKTRKICARMFFETLVLKSYELVDVQQEEPYGDITLNLTPNLSKVQI